MFKTIIPNLNYNTIRLASQFNKQLLITVGDDKYSCLPPSLSKLSNFTSTNLDDLYCSLLNKQGIASLEFNLDTVLIEINSSTSHIEFSNFVSTGELTLIISENSEQLDFSF